jgi:Caspase domain
MVGAFFKTVYMKINSEATIMRYLSRVLTSIAASLVLILTQHPVSDGHCPLYPSAARLNAKQPLKEPTRRALLIGINTYQTEPSKEKDSRERATIAKPGRRMAANAKSGSSRSAFTNLDGPNADVETMRELLIRKFGFTEVKALKDGEATREAILRAIDDHLIRQSEPGDICVLYYSGHGSKVKNSKGGESDGYDESIVPADINQGGLDIRDKEIARLFLKAIDKGVTITAIFDSCHSGSVGRGSFAEERTRTGAFDERDISDPPGFKQTPSEKGALFFYAAQDYQEAKERRYKGVFRGNFSWALSQVLSQPSVSVNESAEQVFRRVISYMKGEQVHEQPALEGNAQRRKGPLFGGQANPALDKPTASVIKTEQNRVSLEGGLAMGLGVGSELKKADSAEQNNLRLRVKSLSGLSSCEAEVIQGDATSIRRGDLFIVDRWVSREGTKLKVWIPPAMEQSEILRIARELKQLRVAGQIKTIEDPTAVLAEQIILYSGTRWEIISPTGKAEAIGSTLELKKLAAEVTAKPVFVSLPPSREMRQDLRLEESIEITKTMQEAEYFLAGRLNGDHIEYAWVRRDALSGSPDQEKKAEYTSPPRSDWFAVDLPTDAARLSIEELRDKAVTLARLKGWLQIQAPASSDFPYLLAVRKTGTSELMREGTVYEGSNYDLMLVADEQMLSQTKSLNRKWVYVFSIDSQGTSTLLFNVRGNLENRFPLDATKPATEQPRVILLGREGMIALAPPLGLDTYILLTSDQELSDPFVLEFSGVRSRGNRPGENDSPLAKLVYGIGSATRGPAVLAPNNWSIDRIYLRSAAKSPYESPKIKR